MPSLRPSLFVFLAIMGLAAGLRADTPVDVDKLNRKIAFTLADAAGKPWSLDKLGNNKAVVVLFLSFDCPVSNSYATTLIDLYQAYKDKGVAFVAINASDELTHKEIARHVAAFRLPFSVLKDDQCKAADLFQAHTAPEAFVLDHNHVLRYRGRIDDAWSARLKRNRQISSRDLENALNDLLAGKDVRTPATKAVGCPIQRERELKKEGKVTYHRDVLPILQKHCQQCHRPGEVGPFALMNYRQAVNWAQDIKDYTHEGKMPPWKVVEGVAFHNERKLTARELATLAAWVDNGTPEGNPQDAPRPVEFTDGWQLGTPDLVLTVPEEMTIGASGKDVFRCFVLPTGLKEDKHVIAVEVRPGNKRIVHHSLNFFDTTGKARELEQQERQRAKKPGDQDHGPGYSVSMGIGFVPSKPGSFGGIGGWAPGQRARFLPEGYGYPLPKNSDIILQLHYHRNGRVEKDQTRIGLYFARKPEIKPYKAAVIRGSFLVIPPKVEAYRVQGAIEMLGDGELRSIMPHMHMLGKAIKVTMIPPDGQPKTLLRIADWDYNWQETYFLEQPIAFKQGTRFTVEAVYDNSDRNPANPFHPPAWVRFGEQTDNEMCFVFLGATHDDRPGRFPFKQIALPAKPMDQ